MVLHLLAIVVLVAVFAIGTTTSVNIGALALVAALLVGAFALGEDASDVLAGFPGDLFLLVFGVTYLFGIATVNGTMELVVQRLARGVGRRHGAVPPMLFVVTFVAVSMGAILPALSAVLGGLALGLCRRLRIEPLLGALMVLFGGLAGSFSPITLLGTIVNSTLARNGIEVSALGLYVLTFAFSCAFAGIAYALHGGARSSGRLQVARRGGPGASSRPAPHPAGRSTPADGAEGGDVATAVTSSGSETALVLTPARWTSLIAIAALVAGLFAFGLDVGMLALVLAVVLHLAHPTANRAAFSQVSWPVIVMLCGIVTYVELLNRTGTIKATGEFLAGLGSPVLAAFLLCVIAAAFSAVGSSAAIITAGISLALPLLAGGAVGTLGFTAALAVSATAVDICPLSSSSALLVASAPTEIREEVYRGLMRWALGLVVAAPAVTTALLVLPGWI